MANTMETIIFQISYATLIIKLLIRVISDLKVTYNYLLDYLKFFIVHLVFEEWGIE